MAASIVEGDWKNFTFRMIDSSNFPEVSKHLRTTFYVDEPVVKIIGPSEDHAQDFDMFVGSVLDEKLSFAAYDKENGKLAAVRIIYRHKKDMDYTQIPFKSTGMKIILGFMIPLDQQCSVFEKYDVDEYADLLIASVDREYRQQGLATEMYKRAIAFLKESGFKVTKSIFTSPYTRIAANKFNFEELARRPFRELQNEKGEYYNPNFGDDEFAAVLALRL